MNIFPITRVQLVEERARLELQGEVGEELFEKKPNLNNFTAFEKSVFEYFKDLNGYGTLDIKEETADTIADISKMIAEIIVIEVAFAGAGAFAGGLGAGSGTVAAGTGVARMGAHGARAGEAARWGRVTRGAYRLVEMAGGTGVGGAIGRGLSRAHITGAANYLAEGASWHARGVNTLVHSTAFIEAQSMLNGHVVNPVSSEGALYIGGMALTLYGLGKVQQFMRGELSVAGGLRDARQPHARQPPRLRQQC